MNFFFGERFGCSTLLPLGIADRFVDSKARGSDRIGCLAGSEDKSNSVRLSYLKKVRRIGNIDISLLRSTTGEPQLILIYSCSPVRRQLFQELMHVSTFREDDTIKDTTRDYLDHPRIIRRLYAICANVNGKC